MESEPSVSVRPLRLWIPLVLLPLMVLARLMPKLVDDGPSTIWMFAAFGPFLISLLIVLWWLAVSRASWKERVFGFLALVVCFAAVATMTIDKSMVGPPLIVMTVPLGIAGFALTLILLKKLLSPKRTVIAVLVALICFGVSELFQNQGVWGDFAFEFNWRWSQTAEEKFLADRSANQTTNSIQDTAGAEAAFAAPEWPGFRGPNRDGVQRDAVFSQSLQTGAPKELWRIQVGPAWSSFAVAGNYLLTQEQRGDEESVVCYDSTTGGEVWVHSVPSRFFEGLGGLGPRATPTIAGGHVYSLGAEGWLMKLDALSGKELWKVDLRQVADMQPPMWGFSSSPLVLDSIVAVHCGGKGDKGIVALSTPQRAICAGQWPPANNRMDRCKLSIL